MCMKGITQPMIKKTLLLTTLLVLCGCTSNKVQDMTPQGKSFINVNYYYAEKEHCYIVEIDDKLYNVPPKNCYYIECIYWTEDYIHIVNEYFVSTNELFVYH